MRDRILELMAAKSELPTLPEIVIKLQKMVRDPSVNVKNIAKLIEVDPVLAGKILKLANSVYYSRSTTPIKTLPVAITKIGLNMLVKLVYSLKLCTMFSHNKVLERDQFWTHSLAVAIFTQSITNHIKFSREEIDIAYLAGLMHDIGIIVFIYLIPDEYQNFLLEKKEDEEPIEVYESQTFGIDHAELGSRFIETWWGVDERISMAVRFHHSPFIGEQSERTYEQIVHVSNGICNIQGITSGTGFKNEVFKEGAWGALGLSLNEVDTIIQGVNDSLEQARELISFGS